MKKILLATAFLMSVSFAQENWQTDVELSHVELSKEYVRAIEAQKRVKMLCKNAIKVAHSYKETMGTSQADDAQLTYYIFKVQEYCSVVAGCAKCNKIGD